MSSSVLPHRWQPIRLSRPWDSPGKNTGVGCHFLLQCVKVKSESEVTQSCPTLSNPMDRSLPGSSIHGIFQARVLEWGAIAFSVLRVTVTYKTFYLSFSRCLFSPSPLITFNSSFTIQIQFIQIIWIYFWFSIIFLTILLYVNLETKNKHQCSCLNMYWGSLSHFLGAVFPVDHLRL